MVELDPTDGMRQRLINAALILIAIVVVGTLGFYLQGRWLHEPWSLFDCFFMTVISITTVGYGELPGMETLHLARLWAIIVILSGLGVAAYAVSALTTYFLEGEFSRLRSRRKMEKTLAQLHDHIIVCGIGTTGIHVVEELAASGWPTVAIDADPQHLQRATDRLPNLVTLLGDATEESVLEHAGIKRARGIVAALTNDRENLYIVVTAREMNPKLRIVAKGVDVKAADKLRRAGADRVVNPALIGGVRLVTEMIRPNVVEFLDHMLRESDKTVRIDEVTVPEDAWIANQTLEQAALRKRHGLLVLAVRNNTQPPKYHYSPSPDVVVGAGQTLVVLGDANEVHALRKSFKQR